MTYEDFSKMVFYQAFENWLYSELSESFYSPESYSIDGELISEEEFDEEGCSRAVEATIKAAVLIYDQLDQNPVKLREKSTDELLQMAGINNDEDIYYVGLYCGLFLCVVADYPNFKGFKGIIWRAFLEIIDGRFDRQDVHIWLQFYAQFSRYKAISSLPELLRDDKIMPYWRKLRQKNLVDDEYQIIYRKGLKNYHVALIANELKCKTFCTWEVLEKHFQTRKKKPFANLRTEYEYFLCKKQNQKDNIQKMIEECFK